MNTSSTREISPRAAIVVVALVLLATVVTGRDEVTPSQSDPKENVSTSEPRALGPAKAADEIDLALPSRNRAEGPRTDLFPARSPSPATSAPPAAIQPAPPPAVPAPPPLPFSYLGRMIDGEKTVVFLARGNDTLSASAGEALGEAYRVESISATAITVVHLPLGTRQVLAIPTSP